MTVLAIETSCDETAVAILRGQELLSSEIASQIAAHQPFGGIVPEVASRNHLRNVPTLLERVTKAADVSLSEMDAFAATSGPGLASSLVVGASVGKGLALGYGKPYLAINHLEGHLLSPFFGAKVEPNVSLVVSGGHTLLVHVRRLNDYTTMGQTLDDAAGEAFDKVAKMLGLNYPGGPEMEYHARRGNAARYNLPRSMLDSGDLNFSFSGLKTAVRYLLPKLQGDFLADLCASFQRSIVDILVKKTLSAARQADVSTVTLSGGVSSNQSLRSELSSACQHAGLRFLAAPSELCTDNAAMIAFAASLRMAQGIHSSITDEIDPNLTLAQS